MKYEKLFNETLNSLNIRHVHTKGFNAEQIYFQLSNAVDNSLDKVEAQINAEHKKFKKAASNTKEKYITADENLNYSNESCSTTCESSCSVLNDEASEDNSASCSGLDGAETNDESSQEEEDTELDYECDFSTESTADFENEIWDDSMSSQAELVNLPACEVLKLLNSRKNGKS